MGKVDYEATYNRVARRQSVNPLNAADSGPGTSRRQSPSSSPLGADSHLNTNKYSPAPFPLTLQSEAAVFAKDPAPCTIDTALQVKVADGTKKTSVPSISRPHSSSQPPRLAVSLSSRQLLNQRLQKYKLPAEFRAHSVGPGQNQHWKGSFWIKGTFIGGSKLERTKGAAKEGAALAALHWLNENHYH